MFIEALSRLLTDREALLEDGRLIYAELSDTAAIDSEIEDLLRELDVVAGLIRGCVNENATHAIDQEAYIRRYDTLAEKYEKLQHRYDTLQKKRDRRLQQADRLSGFLFAVKELDTLDLTFTPALWHATVDHIIVHYDGRLMFRFRNGGEVEVRL